MHGLRGAGTVVRHLDVLYSKPSRRLYSCTSIVFKAVSEPLPNSLDSTIHSSTLSHSANVPGAPPHPPLSAQLPRIKTSQSGRKKLVFDNRGPNFEDFLRSAHAARLTKPNKATSSATESTMHAMALNIAPYLEPQPDAVVPLAALGQGRRFYIEVYGCQMNVNDTEVLMAIMQSAGYQRTLEQPQADIIFLMTCSIRDNAEKKIWTRLRQFKAMHKPNNPAAGSAASPPMVGVLGCMAERLKDKLLDEDKLVDVVCGPDAYRSLPYLVSMAHESMLGVANVLLSADETYADVTPVRLHSNQVSAHLSIMRGCNNMCSFCIVPFTRGTERSRPIASIVREVAQLSHQGVKEVMLLGQNVNSYRDTSEYRSYPTPIPTTSTDDLGEGQSHMSRGFKTIYKTKHGGRRFTELMEQVAQVDPEMRVRFTSPHPKDFPDDLLYLVRDYRNICSNIHLPLQSGSSTVLERMRRGYTHEAYLDLVNHIRSIIPQVTLSTDVIAGFCGETEAEHRETVTVMDKVKYDLAYMFAYSMREKTHAHRRYQDDVPAADKSRRLAEIIDVFHRNATVRNQQLIGQSQLVLVDSFSQKHQCWQGRTDGNHKAFIQHLGLPTGSGETMTSASSFGSRNSAPAFTVKPGDYVEFIPTTATATALRGYAPAPTTLARFYREIAPTFYE
ncbi:hypothetical protein H4R34_002686 [Dimargaris verticillata]|uniref:CDK5RAP1-like protein n=1 Tax=Dimargaris verticillata TaxID=2761393 RepID=A0A9W8EDC2_9FUNG|nr:hypothetical protein H4R34_002686 [Dimargaris verticillata]